MKKLPCPKCGYANRWDAAYCGLCYEPLNRRPATPPGAATEPPSRVPPAAPPARRPLPQALKIGLALAGLTLVLGALLPNLPGSRPEGTPESLVNRYAGKTDAADRLLEGLCAGKDKLLADIAADAPDPDAFAIQGRYTARLMKLEDDYANALNALALPRASALDKGRDSAYLAWAEDHLRRENEAAKNFSDRYQALLQKAQPGR